ncbi:8948_t:CDS:1, partial [Gigaspora rosea]
MLELENASSYIIQLYIRHKEKSLKSKKEFNLRSCLNSDSIRIEDKNSTLISFKKLKPKRQLLVVDQVMPYRNYTMKMEDRTNFSYNIFKDILSMQFSTTIGKMP